MDFRRRSNSRERIRRDPSDNVTYDRNIGDGDEVSIGVEWSGLAAWVSISKAQKWEPFQLPYVRLILGKFAISRG